MSGVLLKGKDLIRVTRALEVFDDVFLKSKSPEEAAEKAREYYQKLRRVIK